MNVTCDKCQKRYSIADEKVRGKSVKIRCKHCQNLISVRGPRDELAKAAPAPAAQRQEDWEQANTMAMPAMDTAAAWFAMVKGKQVGPMDVFTIIAKVKAGEVTQRTYMWKQGMADWKRAGDVPDMVRVFAGVLPPGSASAAAPPPLPTEAPSSATGSLTGAKAAGAQAQPVRRNTSQQRAVAATRDVATGVEAPVPEIVVPRSSTPKKGNGHGPTRSEAVTMEPAAELEAQGGSTDPTKIATNPLSETVEQKPLLTDEDFAAVVPGGGGSTPGEASSSRTVDQTDEEPAVQGASSDPFAKLGDIDPAKLPPPGEATQFFIAQAGVNKRNPPWKIAAFIVTPVVVIGLLLFGLSTLNVVPLQVTRVDDQGNEVKESIFSGGGIKELGDILSGRAKERKEALERAKKLAADRRRHDNPQSGRGGAGKGDDRVEKVSMNDLLGGGSSLSPDQIKTLTEKTDRQVKARIQPENAVATSEQGLSNDQVGPVIARAQPAFQTCIETELRKNPDLKVKRCEIIANVEPSGVVSSVQISEKPVDMSDLGKCIKSSAKRMVFPQSEGQTEVRIPLIVSTVQ